MYERKYEKYNVKVIFQSKSEHYFNKDKDITNYKEMMEQYRIVRDKHKTNRHVARIEFIGVNAEGETEVIFSKEMNNNKLKKEEVSNDVNNHKDLISKNTSELVKSIMDIMSVLKQKYNYHNNLSKIKDKQQDIVLHNIENLKYAKINNDVTVNEYNKKRKCFYNDLEKIRSERRFHKSESAALRKLLNRKSVNDLTVVQLKQALNNFHIDNKPRAIADRKTLALTGIYNEARYTNEKEKVKLYDSLRTKYTNVYVDEFHNVIYAYNKAYNH